jgi:hypothetical protein
VPPRFIGSATTSSWSITCLTPPTRMSPAASSPSCSRTSTDAARDYQPHIRYHVHTLRRRAHRGGQLLPGLRPDARERRHCARRTHVRCARACRPLLLRLLRRTAIGKHLARPALPDARRCRASGSRQPTIPLLRPRQRTSHAFLDEGARKREHRNEPVRPRLQSEANDLDGRRRTAYRDDPGMS